MLAITEQTEASEKKDPEVWMVAGTPYEQGCDTPTFGPFKNREEAVKFAGVNKNYHVYDDVKNRKSLCGPWYL